MTNQEILEAFQKLDRESADYLLQIVSSNLQIQESQVTREAIEESLINLFKNFGGFEEALMSYIPEDNS
jgi:hypothetical protein